MVCYDVLLCASPPPHSASYVKEGVEQHLAVVRQLDRLGRSGAQPEAIKDVDYNVNFLY